MPQTKQVFRYTEFLENLQVSCKYYLNLFPALYHFKLSRNITNEDEVFDVQTKNNLLTDILFVPSNFLFPLLTLNVLKCETKTETRYR